MANTTDSVAAASSPHYPRPQDSPLAGRYGGSAPLAMPVQLAPHQPPRPSDHYTSHLRRQHSPAEVPHRRPHPMRHHYGAAYSHHPYMPPGAAIDDGSQHSPQTMPLTMPMAMTMAVPMPMPMPMSPQQPLAGAEERERKRRISHSAMERRRRERTNNIINELKALIPWLRDEARLQKLEVLEQCVCYIKELQASAGDPQALSARRKPVRQVSDDDCSNNACSDNACCASPSPSGSPRRQPLSAPAPLDASMHAQHMPRAQSPAAGHRRLSGSDLPDLPDLATDDNDGASSKASSTASTIGPFRGPLPKGLAEHAAAAAAAAAPTQQPPSPGSKNSIGFLTS